MHSSVDGTQCSLYGAQNAPLSAPSARSDLGVVELHGVVGGEGHHQAFLVELQQRVLGVFQEQAVVAEGGHGDGDLGQEVEVLQHGALWGGGRLTDVIRFSQLGTLSVASMTTNYTGENVKSITCHPS